MRFDHRRNRSAAGAANFASTASALIALVAVAAAMNSLSIESVRSAILESRATPIETPTVRAVAEAVAAAARDLAGSERTTAALPADHFAKSLAAPLVTTIQGVDDSISI